MSLNPLLPSGKRKVNACAIELKNEKRRQDPFPHNLHLLRPLDIPYCDECHMEHDCHTVACSKVKPLDIPNPTD